MLFLATMVVTRSDRFAKDMLRYSQAFAFREDVPGSGPETITIVTATARPAIQSFMGPSLNGQQSVARQTLRRAFLATSKPQSIPPTSSHSPLHSTTLPPSKMMSG